MPDGALGKQFRSFTVSTTARRSGSALVEGSEPAHRPNPNRLRQGRLGDRPSRGDGGSWRKVGGAWKLWTDIFH